MGKKDRKTRRSRSPSREKGHRKKISGCSDSSGSESEVMSSSDSCDDSKKKSSGHKHKRSRSGGRKHKHKKKSRQLTEEEIEELKEEKRKQKEIMKALETPEEKRARRVAKKEAKERKRKAQMGWDEEYMGYTNADNPFGDEQLLNTFVWQKKMEKEGKESLPNQTLEKLQKQKMIENKLELEKVKKRRVEREKEREERDKEREMLQRDKEAEYYRVWETQEDHFHLDQAKLRSKIRITDGRAKPIDLLAQYISADDDMSIEMHEPYTYLNGLTITDLEDLLEDIKVYMELEQDKNMDYWRDITIIVQDEISKLQKIDPTKRGFVGERRSGINQSVSEDVNKVFKDKTTGQLAILEQSIRNKLKGGEGVDVGYWESLLQQLKAHLARTRLRDGHQQELRRKLFKLKQEQGIENAPLFPIVAESGQSPSVTASQEDTTPHTEDTADTEPQPGTSTQTTQPLQHQKQQTQKDEAMEEDEEGGGKEEAEGEAVITERDLVDQSYGDYESGRYSPVLLQLSNLEPDTILYDPAEDMKRLDYARRQFISTGSARQDVEEELIEKAKAGMNEDEAQFSVEMPLEKQTMVWSDKYRPRKPRFFNRVHTGFEWNKYNQTHYDIDNPPPKIVQGYKFNIFYPDLIDKADTPQYTLTPLEGNRDFGMLKFSSGPPYEDIAFKIVNREWEYSYKRGFRCQFHNNIFQLWFHFKRYRYRR